MLSTIRSLYDNAPTHCDITWADLAAHVADPSTWPLAADKGDGILISHHDFGGGLRREQYHVRTHHAWLDLDGVTDDQLLEVLTLVDARGWEALAYSTWSDGDPKNRPIEQCRSIRLVIALSRPVLANEWHAFIGALIGQFPPGTVDLASRRPTQFYFPPTRAGWWDLLPNVRHEPIGHHFQGQPLNPDDMVANAVPNVRTVEWAPGDRPISRESLAKLASNGKRSSRSADHANALGTILNADEPFATSNRHNAFTAMCAWLANKIPDDTDLDMLSAILHPGASLAWLDDEPDYCTVDYIREKFESIWRKQAEEGNKRLIEASDALQIRCEQAWQSVGVKRASFISPDEFAAIAARSGITPDRLERQLIVQADNLVFFRVGDGYCVGMRKSEAQTSAHQFMAPYHNLGFVTQATNRNGDIRSIPFEHLFERYGTNVDGVKTTFVRRPGIYDGVLYVAPRLPKHEPEADPQFEDFLQVLVPDDLQRENFKRWMANLLDHQHTFAMPLMLSEGFGNVGKNMIANGLARLWGRNSPVSGRSLFGNFNGEMASCPFVFIDEKIPRDHRGRVQLDRLREFIGSSSIELHEKGRNRSELEGAPRIIGACNSLQQFFGSTEEDPDTFKTTNERMFIVRCSEEASAHLDGLSRDTLHRWVEEGGIARHAMWLASMPQYRRIPTRFGVEIQEDKEIEEQICKSAELFNPAAFDMLIDWLKPGSQAWNCAPFITTRTRRICVKGSDIHRLIDAMDYGRILNAKQFRASMRAAGRYRHEHHQQNGNVGAWSISVDELARVVDDCDTAEMNLWIDQRIETQNKGGTVIQFPQIKGEQNNVDSD